MRGINLFEEAHVVNALPAINGTGGKLTDVWSMKNFRAANIIFGIGVSAAAPTKLLVFACDDSTGANPVAIPYKLYKCETTNDDKFGPAVDITAAGYTPVATDNIMYGIYIDAQALASSGKGWLYASLTNGTNSILIDCKVILTGPGYEGSNNGITAIA